MHPKGWEILVLMCIWLFCWTFKLTLRGFVPLTKFDIQFEAIYDVYYYENHVETLFPRTRVRKRQHLVILTFPWDNTEQFSSPLNRKCLV